MPKITPEQKAIQEQFSTACRKGDEKIVRELIVDPRIDINKRKQGYSPLFLACREGHLEIVKLLLSRQDIDVKAATKNVSSPFYAACKNGHTQVVTELLADARIDPNQKTKTGFTPLHIACSSSKEKVVQLLLQDPRVIKDAEDDEGRTPFHIVCERGASQITQMFLDIPGIDINKADKVGSTPFFAACINNHLVIVAQLLAFRHLDVNKATKDGRTPFYAACRNGHVSIVRRLLQSGYPVDVNKETEKGFTAFYRACEESYKEIVSLLIADPRVDVNKATKDGKTPFFVACAKNEQNIVATLLNDPRVDIKKVTNEKLVPFYYICSYHGHLISAFFKRIFINEPDLLKINNTMLLLQSSGLAQEEYEFHEINGNMFASKIGMNLVIDLKRADVLAQQISDAKLQAQTALASDALALVVMLCDGFFGLSNNLTKERRFLSIASKLPLELQMILCNQVVGSAANFIFLNDRERSFKAIGKREQLLSIIKECIRCVAVNLQTKNNQNQTESDATKLLKELPTISNLKMMETTLQKLFTMMDQTTAPKDDTLRTCLLREFVTNQVTKRYFWSSKVSIDVLESAQDRERLIASTAKLRML
jgi:ankyrin repeat protein